MRFALIGLGAAGRNHLEVLSHLPGVEVVGIADLNPASVQALAARYPVPVATTDPQELIAHPGVEVVAIAAADRAHHPLVMACAAAGKHVVCEKPIATEVPHAREMVAAMRAAGRLFCVSLNNRGNRVQRRIKDLVDAGAVGNARVVRLIGLLAAPDNRNIRASIGEAAARARAQNICEEGKNALFDCGVHSFDYARFLTGSEFRRIEAMGHNMRGFTHPDHGVALCEHENGVFTVIEKGFDYAYEAQTRKEYVRYEVIGDGGSLAWDTDTLRLRLYGRDQTLDERMEHPPHNEDRRVIYQGFVESVHAGRLLPWLASGEDGLKALEAAQAALDSMHAKGVIRRDVGFARNWWEGA
ncbi:MAG: Gfo/Idh/MocA family oxidoreductase [Armatimonadota bacterium]|nr:Gfo/Idh/MocA family oxidoreductase [Armatimonadota bacterium]